MPFHRGSISCGTAPSCSATVVAVTYTANNQLQSNIVTGSTPSTPFSFPNEGVYILSRNRALQIAGPPCDRRHCNFRQICLCDADRSSNIIIERSLSQLSRQTGPSHDCLVSCMHLYEATEVAYMAGMSIFAVPRTLTWASSFGYYAFRYDTDLEENCALFSFDLSVSLKASKVGSQLWLGYMVDGWRAFLNRGSYKPDCFITSIPDSGDDSGYDSASDADWDDFDIPLEGRDSKDEEEESDDFDLIDDLIEEEFPHLRKTYSRNQGHASSVEDVDIYYDAPVPVIIPPKNMVIGRALVR
ncbi:hypothetical protein F4809DRAFT_639121 [Biscogniauxia mediterranea]|nr:hypothetical protein F4809DRAFT_639121 [Biscogniauxia mediterranea]